MQALQVLHIRVKMPLLRVLPNNGCDVGFVNTCITTRFVLHLDVRCEVQSTQLNNNTH